MKITLSTHNIMAANRHIQALGKIFGSDCVNNYAIFETLLRAEKEAHRKTTAACNGEISDESFDKWNERFLARLKKNLGVDNLPSNFFINGDPRGYALKLKEGSFSRDSGIWTDFGGYGILAPDFS